MTRIEREKLTVERMVRLYCRHKEGNRHLCDQCGDLIQYAMTRLSRCPFGDNKPSCRMCTVHCYRPDMRRHMREVMRYAGPRMILFFPAAAIRHMLAEMRHRHKNNIKNM